MTKTDFLDQPPGGAALTAYDRDHSVLYLRLLDAEAEGADWREIVRVLFGVCPDSEPERASYIYTAHLERAKWVTESGFTQIFGPRLH